MFAVMDVDADGGGCVFDKVGEGTAVGVDEEGLDPGGGAEGAVEVSWMDDRGPFDVTAGIWVDLGAEERSMGLGTSSNEEVSSSSAASASSSEAVYLEARSLTVEVCSFMEGGGARTVAAAGEGSGANSGPLGVSGAFVGADCPDDAVVDAPSGAAATSTASSPL